MAHHPTHKRLHLTVLALLLVIVGLTLYVVLSPRLTKMSALQDFTKTIELPFVENTGPIFFMQFVKPPSDIHYSMRLIEPELPSEYPIIVPSR
jgi:hypothetical protein